jgi:hypothetical protein
MGPAHARLPSTLPFAPNITADQIGLGLVGGVAAVTAAHGAATYARELRNRVVGRRRAAAAAIAGVAAAPVGGAVATLEPPEAASPGPVEPPPPESMPAEPVAATHEPAATLEAVAAPEAEPAVDADLSALDEPRPNQPGADEPEQPESAR